MNNVRQLQRSLYRKAKQDKEGKVSSLYDKLWRADGLWEAWRHVKANRGAPGVDGESIEALVSSGREGEMLNRVREQLRTKTTRFHPVRRVDIPKPKGGTRPLGMATGEDRVVQTAMKLILEPIFEADFHDCSYGYRPKRSAKMASVAIREDLYQGAWSVVEIDFQRYCTTIPHEKLLTLIRQRIVEGRMLRIINRSLKVGVAYQGRVEPVTIGVPQGAPISPLTSNIYVNVLDQVWHKRGDPEKLGATLHRYADDAVLVCRRDARQALEAFATIAHRMGLGVNRDKTRITKRTDGCDFVGLQCVTRRSPTTGKYTMYIFPGKASQRRVRRRIKAFTTRRAPIPPDAFVQQSNQTVRGWANYYRHTNASQAFRTLQRCINTRVRRYLTSRRKGRGFGWKKTLAAGISGTRELLCMLCDEDCRTAVLGKTECPVGWEGNGQATTARLVRHCERGNPQKRIGRVYRRRTIPLP
jgi:group II intron reverse transcriptase/maturase